MEDIFKKSVEPGFKERFAPVTTHECWCVKISNDKAGPFGTCAEIFPDSFWTEIPPFFHSEQEDFMLVRIIRLTTLDNNLAARRVPEIMELLEESEAVNILLGEALPSLSFLDTNLQC